MPHGEFSVYWWDRDGGQHEELRCVDAETAVNRTRTLCTGPGAKLKIVSRVIITDGGDSTNFEWIEGKVIFDGEYKGTY